MAPVKFNPARRDPELWNRLGVKEAYRLLYREGLNRSQALERIKYEVADIPEIRHLVESYQKSSRGVL